MKNLLDHVYDLLKQDERLVSTEGDLLKNKIQELTYKLDEGLITLLLSDERTKKEFFVNIGEVVIFDQKKFVEFVNNKEFLPDSYTAYKNKIGLKTGHGQMVSESGDVVLDRPYKDCILAGGQDQEDAKRDEIFYNEVLGSDQIDRLFDPKAFTNFKKYTTDGEQELEDFTRDEEGTIRDNLIIKGNNLLALHSLKKEFAGKVKLIYIDPPYNTGNDGFKYNDRFNHSTWLTFMKNRLEVAKSLLRDDGVIFVQCDDNEQAYLKVLMDDIFDGNFLNTISVKSKVSAGASGGGEDKRIKKNIEYIHCYYNQSFVVFNDVYRETEIQSYINLMKNKGKSFKYTQVLISTGEKEKFKTIKDGSGEDIIIYHHKNVKIKTISQLKKEENLNTKDIYNKYFGRIFTTTNAQSSIRKRVWDAVGENKDFYSIEYIPKSGKNKGKLTTQYYTGNKMVLLVWFSSTAMKDVKGNVIKKEKYGTFWDGIDYNNLNKEGDVIFPSGKKPEQLIHRVLEMSTCENDIILDYHLGSGTTCAVAHKMNRQYIGIEQMDYIENLAVARLNNVIAGDQSGISKAVDRQGGGEFVYMELAQNNEKLIQAIQDSDEIQELVDLYYQLKDSSFINYTVDIQAIDDTLSEFESLSLDNQKRFLIELIDKNALYINYSEMDDESYAMSEADKTLNRKFYQ